MIRSSASPSWGDATLPKVSVVLPTIAVDSWLDAAVASVLDQEGVDVELIVVHDGVPVDPQRNWTRDHRVVCLSLGQRSGLAHALNLGIERARHPLVARLDADDIALSGRLSSQARFLSEHPDTVVLGSFAKRINECGKVTGSLGESLGGDARNALLSRNVLIHSSVLFRADPFHKVGRYDQSMRQMEDYDLWLRMSLEGEIRIMPEPLVAYRVHSNQMSRKASPFSNYSMQVLRARRRLARHMGANAVAQWQRDGIWWVAQAVRYWGFRKPRYVG
ncbi:glycosyltransferase [Knoellia sp. GCM10027209]|uniref:glycosyltransferase n=1 Tax=Knoellia sp. GCM10027209 TaxID=3273396 RepID=UPI003615FD04